MRPIRRAFFVQENFKCGCMLGLVGTVDKPISVEVVPSRSYLMDVAGNLYDGASHGWHFQFRHSFPALEGKRRRKTDLISIKMLGGHVRIVYCHSERIPCEKISWDLAHSVIVFTAASTLSSSKAFVTRI